MRIFGMCPECAKEYHNPGDRQFHAQPMRLLNAGQNWNCGTNTALAVGGDESLRHPAVAIRDGLIVAVKGLVGFQLMVDASNEWRRACSVLQRRRLCIFVARPGRDGTPVSDARC